MSLEVRLANTRVLIVAGAGGVGKTTCAAALALSAACRGRRVAVLTIDPARRLAQALGLEAFGDEAAHVALPAQARRGGSLDAMMLDVRATYDRLVERTVADPARVQAILANPFYRHFTDSLSGSHDYTAVEKLYELVEAERYDLVVLDTPPSTQALDFLSAPRRLVDAFDDSLYSWFAGTGVLASGYILKTLSRFTGASLLNDLSAFLAQFREMLGGLRSRAAAVQAFLREETTAFLVVTRPSPPTLTEAAHFAHELRRLGYRPEAYLVNRVERPLKRVWSATELACALPPEAGWDEAGLARLVHAQTFYQNFAGTAWEAMRRLLRAEPDGLPVYLAPFVPDEPTNIPALLDLAAHMKHEDLA